MVVVVTPDAIPVALQPLTRVAVATLVVVELLVAANHAVPRDAA